MRKFPKNPIYQNIRCTKLNIFISLGWDSVVGVVVSVLLARSQSKDTRHAKIANADFEDLISVKNFVYSKKVVLFFLSQATYFDYIESLPRFQCSFPTITWFRSPENRIPENFKENRPLDLKILKAPDCPKTEKIIRLIKTSPFNFELRERFSEFYCN